MKRSGVTLIEFLVVIAIIGVLFGLVANAVLFARRASLDMQCKNNLRQMMLAHVSYFSQSPDYFPDGDKDIKAFAPHYKILENMGTPVQFGPKMFYPNSPFFRCPNDPTLANLEYIGEALPEILLIHSMRLSMFLMLKYLGLYLMEYLIRLEFPRNMQYYRALFPFGRLVQG